MHLQARSLTVNLGDRMVLHEVELELFPGEVVGLVGPNGAGKSTLLRALVGLLPASGEITLDGRALSRIAHAERARLLAHLPQTRIVTWPVSVADLVALGRHPWRDAATPAAQERIADAMRLMDVQHLAGRPATELSGGEQARVLAARAVAQDTPLLLADEPASGLDPAHQIRMMQALRRLAGRGRGVLVSLHDLGLAARWCDRIVVLSAGRVAAAGTAQTVLDDGILDRVFGVAAFRADDGKGPILMPTSLSEAEEP